jgi:hypothetical protein
LGPPQPTKSAFFHSYSYFFFLFSVKCRTAIFRIVSLSKCKHKTHTHTRGGEDKTRRRPLESIGESGSSSSILYYIPVVIKHNKARATGKENVRHSFLIRLFSQREMLRAPVMMTQNKTRGDQNARTPDIRLLKLHWFFILLVF